MFAVQNVIKDPPFTKLELISCRNLLIELDRDGRGFTCSARAGGTRLALTASATG